MIGRDYFVYDGKSSLDFNTYIASSNLFDGAERDVTVVEVPGRNGALTLDNGRYRNVEAIVTVYVPTRMREHVPALREFLASRRGYCKYEDSIHPEEYRMARFTGGFVVSASDRQGAAIDLNFDCMPQRFLKRGDIPVAFTAAGTIRNLTDYDARPTIIVYGTAGAVTVNGVQIQLSGITGGSALIDCEAMEIPGYNSSAVLTHGVFPCLEPGSNAVSFTGFTKVEIIPRWWTV